MSRPGKTGGCGGPWIALEIPKPPRVSDRYMYWIEPPPELSARCLYWLRQIERGWLPNSSIAAMGYDQTAQWFGVYLWEYLNVLCPRVSEAWRGRRSE